MKKQISILGCGWLGFPLAKYLISIGFDVNGSTTSIDKLSYLKSNNINPFLIKINENEVIGNFDFFLKASQTLIINIPPQRRQDIKNYNKRLQNLLYYIEKSAIKHVLFVSSTSVYAPQKEVITEITPAKPDSLSGLDILNAEKTFQNLKNQQTTILRLAGLIGAGRHPVHFLAGKTNLPNPNHAVNLICLDDCIKIIAKIIAHNSWSELFIGVNQSNMTVKLFILNKPLTIN